MSALEGGSTGNRKLGFGIEEMQTAELGGEADLIAPRDRRLRGRDEVCETTTHRRKADGERGKEDGSRRAQAPAGCSGAVARFDTERHGRSL